MILGRFEGSNDPRSHVIWGCLPLVGSPKAKWLRGQLRGPDKARFRYNPYDDLNQGNLQTAGVPSGVPESAQEPGLGKRPASERLVTRLLPMGSGWAQLEE